ncbi:hypothetical protein LSUE1_G001449 [Lachnellula suecica]|uniref:Uncharacterized protein n=1 Tax=Lachnellula suecica TaxID=602035 RepID=A0A8T9CID2_9HELO|nr:hypothetical protein LSUE1_G001449 [Lachnellula suecica]
MFDEPETKRKGARSLFSTSLRAVPSYIADEEAHIEKTEAKSAINTRDISTEIYDELENFGSSGHGWKQLKIIVRSHGMQVLGDAIAAGVIDVEFCGILITLCIHTFAIEEAEILLSSLLASGRYTEPKTLYDAAPRQFSMLWKFVEYTGRFSFQYKQLTSLISCGVLPLGWLATKEFRPVWTGIIQRLSPDSTNSEALIFLESSLPFLAGCGQLSNSSGTSSLAIVKHTFASLLATLLSIVVLSREGADAYSESQMAAPVAPYEHVTTLLQTCATEYDLSHISNSQGVLLLAANLIAGEQLDGNSNSSGRLVELLHDRSSDSDNELDGAPSNYNELVTFICSVARCCGRGASSVGFEYLKYLHHLLENIGNNGALTDIFQGVIVDSAFTFAQQLPDQNHIDYVSIVDAKFSERDVKHHLGPISEADDETRPGFRWEEGIGEWVMTTPSGNNSKQESISKYSLKGESESDSPFKSPPRQHQNKGKEVLPLARKRSIRSSNVFVEPEDDLSVLDDMDSSAGPLYFETEDAASEDELQTTFSCSNDFAVSADSASEEDEEVFSTETSFCSEASVLEENACKSIRRVIDRAPRLSRKVLRKSHDWHVFDESFGSTASSLSSPSTEPEGKRQYVDRVPRLGRRALRRSQTWQLFDESDDELSFLSASSKGDSVLRDITQTPQNTVPVRKGKAITKQRKPIVNWNAMGSDSEDELGL